MLLEKPELGCLLPNCRVTAPTTTLTSEARFPAKAGGELELRGRNARGPGGACWMYQNNVLLLTRLFRATLMGKESFKTSPFILAFQL